VTFRAHQWPVLAGYTAVLNDLVQPLIYVHPHRPDTAIWLLLLLQLGPEHTHGGAALVVGQQGSIVGCLAQLGGGGMGRRE